MPTKIKTETGNLLNVKEGHIVHGCNAQGVMGSGVALAIKQTYPAVFTHYRNIHENSGLPLGEAYPVRINNQLVVWNAITQDTYGYGTRQVSYDAIQLCFERINRYLHTDNQLLTTSTPSHLYIPLIGAARGGGNWEIIREIIEQTMDFPVTLILPDTTVTTR